MDKTCQLSRNQKGTVQFFLIFSALAIIIFLGISSFAPLQDKLLSTLNRKNDSFASALSDTSHTAKVLVLKYYPLDSTGQKLDFAITGMNDSLSDIRSRVDYVTTQGITQMTNGTKFHGYKDPTAQPAITYQVADTKEYLEALPVSTFRPPNNNVTFRPDYQQILTRENICNYVDIQGVSQVWLWGYHHGNIEPAESDMSMGNRSRQFWNHGSYGDVSNSEQSNNMPICNNTYVLYNYNYSRGLGELLEDHGHQIEFLYRFIDGAMWNNFQRPNGETDPSIINHCGWTHSPPNAGDWSGPRGQYQWNDKTLVKSNCEDWQPDGGGAVKEVNCNTWYEYYYKIPYADIACQDDGGVAFKVWWMQNLPGRGNNLTYQGKPLRNWWDFYADFDAAIASSWSLLADSSPNLQVSSTISANGWHKDYLVDGKLDSTPASMGWTSNSNLAVDHEEWVQLDLGSNKNIDQVKLYPRSDIPGRYFPIDFKIQTSLDNNNFITEVQKTNYPNPGNQVQSFIFQPTQARFIKLLATKLMNEEGGQYRMQLAEIQVLESEDTDNDGFSNAQETFMGTNPNRKCAEAGDNAWPVDVNNDTVVNGQDTSFLIPYISGEKSYDRRYDLNQDGAITQEGDVPVLQEYFLLSCTPVSPSPIASPSPTPDMKVKIISPNGGESFNIGEKVTINWEGSPSRTSYNLGWTLGPGSYNSIAFINSGETTSYDWTVNVGNLPTGASRQIKIDIFSYPEDGNNTDQSDNFFTVTAILPSPSPSPSPRKPGDTDRDDDVDIFDYNQILTDFGKTNDPDVLSDFDNDDDVDIFDYSLILFWFGK